jgi:hypothetical protein
VIPNVVLTSDAVCAVKTNLKEIERDTLKRLSDAFVRKFRRIQPS